MRSLVHVLFSVRPGDLALLFVGLVAGFWAGRRGR
jgi:hypothetical protein